MSILPEVSDIQTISYDYFPATWQAVVWRNWGYVPAKRIARAIGTTEANVRDAAKEMGLNPRQEAQQIWEKRGFLTIIRNNWHICTYEQILTLLDMSAEKLAFILKEDDFMWVKMGGFKPLVQAPMYEPLNDRQQKETEKLRAFAGVEGEEGVADFAFVQQFQEPLTEEEWQEVASLVKKNEDGSEPKEGKKTTESKDLRMLYPYFALYGDCLIDESLDPLPERLLWEYAKAGVNGIWMQGMLYQLVEFPFKPELSVGCEQRIQALKRLAKKADKFGIGIYLYLNEPRAMSEEFFETYPHLKGMQEGDYYAMCTSTPEVQEHLYNSMKNLFAQVPELAGFFTITMSENLTNCYSRAKGRTQTCPRCSQREPWEVVAEVNNLLARGAHAGNPKAKAIAWSWGWEDSWAEKVVPLLDKEVILQCTSEEALEFCIGGTKGRVLDYTMSLCGPGKKAKGLWKAGREAGLAMSAKVQMNNTWEMSAVPFLPVFDKVAEHIEKLKASGVRHLHAGWTLGGYPSPNLRLVSWLMEGKGTTEEFLKGYLGEELGEVTNRAQQKFSEAFSEFPFFIDVLYYAPQNFGPMAPFFLGETGFHATMVGFPHDDVERWSGIYTQEVLENQFAKLCLKWQEGIELMETCEEFSERFGEILLVAKGCACHFLSAWHHIRFVRARNEGRKDMMLEMVRAEQKTVSELISLRKEDSRVGYESSNHYFYTMQDLKEKLINLSWCEERLETEMRTI